VKLGNAFILMHFEVSPPLFFGHMDYVMTRKRDEFLGFALEGVTNFSTKKVYIF
jgi:hypothetical protein